MLFGNLYHGDRKMSCYLHVFTIRLTINSVSNIYHTDLNVASGQSDVSDLGFEDTERRIKESDQGR